MFTFIKDLFTYPFASQKESNRFGQFLQFLAKDYPAYFRAKPSVWRIVVLPLLLLRIVFIGVPKL